MLPEKVFAPKNGACVLEVFDILVLKLLQCGNDEKCDETPIAAFGRAGGLGRKSHPTWTLRVCALRGLHPAESRRRRPREFPIQVDTVKSVELPGLCWSSCPAYSITGAPCSDSGK